MRRSQFKAIAHRDFLLITRTSWYILPLALFQLIVMQYTTMNTVLQPTLPRSLQSELLAGLMAYVPLMIIPFIGNMVFNKTILEERHRQTLIRTLATGVTPGMLWWTKFVLAVSFSYGIMVLGIAVTWGLAWFIADEPLRIETAALVNILMVSPAISLSMLAIMSFLCWVFKRPALLMFVPMLIMFGSWSLSSSSPRTTLFSPLLAGTVLGASAGVILLCGWGSAKISKERISGLY